MTTIITADLHLAENPRDAYRFQFLERTLPALVEEHGATRVLVLGDLTESKDSHRAPLVNRIVDGFAALAERVDVCVLRGNHDYVSDDVPFYRFLRHLDRVRWINEPTTLKLRGLGNCLFLPHTRNLEDWVDLMFDTHDRVFCHQTFGGSDLGHGYEAKGASPPFTKNAKVVAGDVHVPQRVGPVTYVGSPTTIDFGDAFEPRVLVLDGDEMRSVPVPGPQKRLIVTDTLDHIGEGQDLQPGDVVKVRVELSGGDDAALGRGYARKAVHDWAAGVGVTLYAVQIITPPAERTEKTTGERHQRSDEELVKMYTKQMNKNTTTLSVGLRIMQDTA